MTSDLYFYNQREFRKIPRRYRKLPEDLPESLRFAHLNPKVAALLANKERIHKQEKEDPFGDGLGQKSLIPDINSAFQNVRNHFDSALSNDEDSQRYLFEEAKFSAQGILEQLSRIIYFYEELYKHIPKSLEYQLMSSYTELTADVTVIPREWQTQEMKEQYAASLQREGASDLEEFDDELSRPRSRLDSMGRTPSEYGSRMNLKKKGGPRLGVIEASPDEDRLGLESRVGGRKTSVSRQSMMSQQQKLHPDVNPSRIGSRVRKGSSVSSHRSGTRLDMSKSPTRLDRSKSPTRLETPKSRLKAAVSKSKMRAITAVLSGMSPSVYKGRIRDDQFSMIDETPSDLRSTALALPSSYMQTINFQLSNKSFEEKGWIMLKGSQEEVDPNAVIEYCVTKLQETMKQTAAIRQKEIEQGYDKSVVVRYYGDTRKETILKFRKSPVRSSQNNIQKGGKPNIPSINDERNEGKKLMQASHIDGTAIIYYPSGRPAIIYSAAGYGRPGYYTIVYDDGLDSRVLACFTPSGKGVCYHPNGVVRFLSTEKGGHISEEDGALGRKWKWPQANIKITEPISFQLNPHLLFRCIGRGQMTVVFNCHKESARFSVSPSPGAEDYKIGEDTEQLLTAFTFSSKTAKDLMRIFAPTKKQKKSKGRKKQKPLIAGLVMKMYKDITAKQSKEEPEDEEQDELETNPKEKSAEKDKVERAGSATSEKEQTSGDAQPSSDDKEKQKKIAEKEKRKGKSKDGKRKGSRKMSPTKPELLEIKDVARFKEEKPSSPDAKAEKDEKITRPGSSKKLSKSKKAETVPEKEKPTRPRSSKRLSKETEKSETKIESEETITSTRSASRLSKREETEIAEPETHEKVARPRSSKKSSKSKKAEKAETKTETDEMITAARSFPRLSRSEKKVKAESKTEMAETIAITRSSPRLSKKASKAESKIETAETIATATSSSQLSRSKKAKEQTSYKELGQSQEETEAKKVEDIKAVKSNVRIEITSTETAKTGVEDSARSETPLEREESYNYLLVQLPVASRRRRGAIQYVKVEESEDSEYKEEAEIEESSFEDEKQMESSKSNIDNALDIPDVKVSSPDKKEVPDVEITSQDKTESKNFSVTHSRVSLSAKEMRHQLSVKEARNTASAKEARSSLLSTGKTASRSLSRDLTVKEKSSVGEGQIHDTKSKPAAIKIKTELDTTQDKEEDRGGGQEALKSEEKSDVTRKKNVTYAADLIRKNALKKAKASKVGEDKNSCKGGKKKDEDVSDHTSKSQASDIVKLLQEFPDKVTYELEADKELARLQRKSKNLVDDWMEHYRIALGLSSPMLETLSAAPPYSIATRQAKSAKQSDAGLMIRKAILGVDDDDNLRRARVPSAPLAGRVAGVALSSSSFIPSQYIKQKTPPPSVPTPIPRLCLSGLSGEKYDEEDDDLLDVPLDYATKRDSMVTFEEPGQAGGDSGLVPAAAAIINRMADTASRRSARSKASSARSISPSRQSVFTSMSERVPSALSGARSHCPLVIRQQILGYERPQCRCSRHHIPFIMDIELDEYVSTEVPEGQLIVIMVVSSLFPGITKAEEMLNEIYQNQNRNRTRPCVQSRSDMFRVFKYDINTAAEMSDHIQPLLLTRHNVVPGMFLMYCDGKLLFCDHIFNGYGSARKDFKKQVMKSRHDAIQGYNLPKDFKFSPSRGKSGLRSAWGGEIGGAGVDKYSSPGTILDSSLVPIHRPLSSSSGNSKEIQLEAVSNEFVDLGPFHKEITVRLKPLVTYRLPKQRLEEAANLLVTSLSTTGLQRASLRPLVPRLHVPESTA